MKVYIVGAGLGKAEYLTEYGKNIINTANLVIATDRLYTKFKKYNQNTINCKISDLIDIINSNSNLESIAILASGDVGFYSVAKTLSQKLINIEIEQISGISSLQYLTAKIKIPYDDIKTISLHGRDINILPFVSYNKRVFALTGGNNRVQDIISELVGSGLGDLIVTVGENLSDSSERIITAPAADFVGMEFNNLSVMLIENKKYINPFHMLRDNEFLRQKTPMTKEEVRNLSLAKLDVFPTDIIFDIGAGTGSMSIAMAYKAFEGMIYAIEKNEDAFNLVKENIKKLGAFNVKTILASAPNGINELPVPNKVFIGGSSGNMDKIIKAVLSKNPNVKVVVNAISLESLNEALTSFNENNLTTEIICVNIARAEKISNYNIMKSGNPIYIITGEKL